MTDSDDDGLWTAYREALFEVSTPLGPICIRVEQHAPALEALLGEHGAHAWCFITASNPASLQLDPATNRARNAELRRALVARALPLLCVGAGRSPRDDWEPEESVLALGVGRDEALRLGRDFGQNAVVWGRARGVAELLDCRSAGSTGPNARTEGAHGALLGTAIGDCLGAPVEGWHPRQIMARYGVLRDFAFGGAPIWTDDTQQALVLAESMLRNGRPDPEQVGRRFVALRDAVPDRSFGAHRGTGSGFRSAVNAFAEHGDWRRSGNPARAGNGASMRIAPIGAAFSTAGDDDLTRAVFEISVLTHREGRALAGALAIAWTAARLAGRGFPLEPAAARSLLAALADWVDDREAWMQSAEPAIVVVEAQRHDFSCALRRVHAAWEGGWPAMRDEIEAFARTRHAGQNFATAGFVLCSVTSALALVLASQDSPEETLVRAVNLGGDADTVGAMVGGLLGAAAGPQAFPARWSVFPGSAAVRAIGRALEAGGDPPASFPDLLALEIELTRRLDGRS